jgi:amino acid transporter
MARLRRRGRGEGRGAGAGRVARRGLWGVARIVSLITAVVVGVIVIGILLTLFDANKSNDIVNAVLDAAKFLVGPFKDVFKPDSAKTKVAVNWGLAAVIYALIGGLIARLLRR